MWHSAAPFSSSFRLLSLTVYYSVPGTLRRYTEALEDRIGRDSAALDAARSRAERLVAMVHDAEGQKLGAFAAAQQAEAELRAHVTRLRVDKEVCDSLGSAPRGRGNAEALGLATNSNDALELAVVCARLVETAGELDLYRERESAREESQRAAVESAVHRALRESVSDVAQEAGRLRNALTALRKEFADQDRNHTRDRKLTADGHAKAFVATVGLRSDNPRMLTGQ